MPKEKRGPDGPGGAAVATSDKHEFNADARAEAREQAPVTIGGQTFHRRRKTWEVTRSLRELLRRQERAGVKADRARKKIDALDADAPDEELFALEDQVDAATDEADEAAYEILALLLKAAEGGESPSTVHLKEHLDSEDAGDLAASLAGGGEPVADPTETPDSSA